MNSKSFWSIIGWLTEHFDLPGVFQALLHPPLGKHSEIMTFQRMVDWALIDYDGDVMLISCVIIYTQGVFFTGPPPKSTKKLI